MDEFRELLAGVKPGEYANVPYHIYEDLFPPGEPDQGARGKAYNAAVKAGLRIENKAEAQQVWFVRDE